jgi:hypothetical protein
VRWIDEVLDLALERPISPRVPVEPAAEAAGVPDKASPQPDVTH